MCILVIERCEVRISIKRILYQKNENCIEDESRKSETNLKLDWLFFFFVKLHFTLNECEQKFATKNRLPK